MSETQRLTKIKILQLPSQLPAYETLKSCRQQELHYNPEFWEFMYLVHRYLESVDEEYLIKRYESIAKNLCRLVSEERHTIPIHSPLSSWYWYRKEHQTRLELHLKGLSLPLDTPKPISIKPNAKLPQLPKYPNAGDIIFRFGSSEWMKPMVEQGQIRIGTASQYIDGTPGDPRTDDELNKHKFIPGKEMKITTESGVNLPIIGDFRETISSPNYYVLCFACAYHPELFNDFKADCCIVIHNPKEFARRINLAFQEQMGQNWFFYHNPVEYFDPYQIQRNDFFNAIASNDFSYAYQMEYRFVWFSSERITASNYLYLDLGSLQDIARLYMHPSLH